MNTNKNVLASWYGVMGEYSQGINRTPELINAGSRSAQHQTELERRLNMRWWEEGHIQLTLSTVLQDADPLADISQVESSLVVTAHVLPDLSYKQRSHKHQFTGPPHRHKNHQNRITASSGRLTDLHHLAQLCQVSGDEVEEGELVKVLGPLVAHLHHLMVTLQQRCFAQSLPAAALIQGLRGLQSHLEERTGFVPK